MEMNTEKFGSELRKTAVAQSEKVLSDQIIPPPTAYDPLIPRKLMEGICGVSTNILVKCEQEGLINPIKVKRGGLDVVVYRVSDIQKILKKRGVSYKKKEEAEVIAIFSQKGGVGKSAFTQHIGAMLSLLGRTLVIDLDSQGDLTNLLNQRVHTEILTKQSELDPTITELMDWTLADGSDAGYRKLPFKEVVKTLSPSLGLIPADLDLGEINYSLNRLNLSQRLFLDGTPKEPSELYMVKDVIDQIKNQYDFIVFDCPPNIETLNVSALLATNRIIIPLELEAKSLLTIKRNEAFLKRLQEMHPGFQWDKVLVVPNKYKKENIKLQAYTLLLDLYRNRTDFQLSEITVPMSSVIDRSSHAQEPMFALASKHGKEHKSVVGPAKEFTNYFWVVLHEVLDIPVDHLVFPSAQADEA